MKILTNHFRLWVLFTPTHAWLLGNYIRELSPTILVVNTRRTSRLHTAFIHTPRTFFLPPKCSFLKELSNGLFKKTLSPTMTEKYFGEMYSLHINTCQTLQMYERNQLYQHVVGSYSSVIDHHLVVCKTADFSHTLCNV